MIKIINSSWFWRYNIKAYLLRNKISWTIDNKRSFDVPQETYFLPLTSIEDRFYMIYPKYC